MTPSICDCCDPQTTTQQMVIWVSSWTRFLPFVPGVTNGTAPRSLLGTFYKQATVDKITEPTAQTVYRWSRLGPTTDTSGGSTLITTGDPLSASFGTVTHVSETVREYYQGATLTTRVTLSQPESISSFYVGLEAEILTKFNASQFETSPTSASKPYYILGDSGATSSRNNTIASTNCAASTICYPFFTSTGPLAGIVPRNRFGIQIGWHKGPRPRSPYCRLTAVRFSQAALINDSEGQLQSIVGCEYLPTGNLITNPPPIVVSDFSLLRANDYGISRIAFDPIQDIIEPTNQPANNFNESLFLPKMLDGFSPPGCCNPFA